VGEERPDVVAFIHEDCVSSELDAGEVRQPARGNRGVTAGQRTAGAEPEPEPEQHHPTKFQQSISDHRA